jgi:hypothetical protein
VNANTFGPKNDNIFGDQRKSQKASVQVIDIKEKMKVGFQPVK